MIRTTSLVPIKAEAIQTKAAQVLFTLDCLVTGVRSARSELKAQRLREQQHQANLAARWQG